MKLRTCYICHKPIPRKDGEKESRYQRRKTCWAVNASGGYALSDCTRASMAQSPRNPNRPVNPAKKRKATWRTKKREDTTRARADKWAKDEAPRSVELDTACALVDIVGPDNLGAWMPAPVRTLSRDEIARCNYQPPVGLRRYANDAPMPREWR